MLKCENNLEEKIAYFKDQNYLALKNECLRTGKLFEDPCFPATDRSIFYTRPITEGVKWMRPSEIVDLNYKPKEPRFIVSKAEANDLDQGYLGNCWFIAGCIAITYIDSIFQKVIPKGQVCSGSDYAGIFHFRFWIYARWHDVVVDDLLPVYDNGTLCFCHNTREPNEFWAALLEKAYAKLCGSYENLESGFTADALIDMSGGLEETLILRDSSNESIWKILVQARRKKSMCGAYIDADPYVPEMKLPNGLIKGHAYIITRTATIETTKGEAYIIRVRNPWGNDVEWNGAWSYNASEWDTVTAAVKEKLESKSRDGEFFMSLDDFCANFDSIQFCHLTPDSLSGEVLKRHHNRHVSWKMVVYHGEWVPFYSAGGCGNGNNNSFWTNPQFLIRLKDVDFEDDEDKTSVIFSLMQKYTREKRTQNGGQISEDFIQFRVYRVRNADDVQKCIQTGQKFTGQQLDRIGNSGDYINKREVVARFRLSPGFYIVVPSLFQLNNPGHFMLRVFTEEFVDENDAKNFILNETNVVKSSEHKMEPPKLSTATTLTQAINVFRPGFEGADERQNTSHGYSSGLNGETLEEHLDNIRKFDIHAQKIKKRMNKKQMCKLM